MGRLEHAPLIAKMVVRAVMLNVRASDFENRILTESGACDAVSQHQHESTAYLVHEIGDVLRDAFVIRYTMSSSKSPRTAMPTDVLIESFGSLRWRIWWSPMTVFRSAQP